MSTGKRIEINIQNDDRYKKTDRTLLIGTPISHESALSVSELEEEIIRHMSNGDLNSFLNSLNGHYSFIYEGNESTIAVVDRMRSYPLFYSSNEGVISISDSPTYISGEIKSNTTSIHEFLTAGYVTGNDTLIEGVSQLCAGQILTINDRNIETSFYIEWGNKEKYSDITNQLHLAIQNSVKSLIEYADGRDIIIPLSGGHDSRVILLNLIALGYDNIKCFSYGREGNKDSAASEKIANSLDVEWAFVDYCDSMWEKHINYGEWDNFVEFSSRYTSIPHVQDWPAIKELKSRGFIQEKAVLVPGHTCTLSLIGRPNQSSHKSLAKAIRDKHFTLQSRKHIPSDEWENIVDKIDNQTKKLVNESKSLLDAFEQWEWQERQSKFVSNSVRTYEFHNLDWYLPLWDRELMNLWRSIPQEERIDKSIYKNVVENLERELNQGELLISQNKGPLFRLVQYIYNIPLMDNMIRKLHYGVYRDHLKNTISGHHLCYDDLEKELYSGSSTSIKNRGRNINYTISKYTLERLVSCDESDE